MNSLAGGSFVRVAGGVLTKSVGEIIGTVGIFGNNSNNDEACAIAGIESVGFTADVGN